MHSELTGFLVTWALSMGLGFFIIVLVLAIMEIIMKNRR